MREQVCPEWWYLSTKLHSVKSQPNVINPQKIYQWTLRTRFLQTVIHCRVAVCLRKSYKSARGRFLHFFSLAVDPKKQSLDTGEVVLLRDHQLRRKNRAAPNRAVLVIACFSVQKGENALLTTFNNAAIYYFFSICYINIALILQFDVTGISISDVKVTEPTGKFRKKNYSRTQRICF
jgi:hypothetical protein